MGKLRWLPTPEVHECHLNRSLFYVDIVHGRCLATGLLSLTPKFRPFTPHTTFAHCWTGAREPLCRRPPTILTPSPSPAKQRVTGSDLHPKGLQPAAARQISATEKRVYLLHIWHLYAFAKEFIYLRSSQKPRNILRLYFDTVGARDNVPRT